MKKERNLNKIRRKNAEIYPIYKMVSWDLLFFYSIEFLFLTITKKITPSEILIIEGFYLFFKMIMQIPAVAITDFIGKRKSIILGNILLICFMLILISFPGVISIIIANIVFSLGYNMKGIAESNLLYDSVSTKGGEGLYSKLEAKGGSWYYLLDGTASLIAGYLFVINNYLPLFICLGFMIISTILSFEFQDVYVVKRKKKHENSIISTIKSYKNDLKSSFKFISKSKRMKAYILFQVVLASFICVVEIYNSELLVNIGIPEEQFSMIFAILTFISGVSISLKPSVEKKFKNRTLAFLSMTYITAALVVAIISNTLFDKSIIPIMLLMFAVQRMCTAIWYILEAKYLKNFTKEHARNKITFAYEFIGTLSASIFSVLGGLLIKSISVQNALLIVGLIGLASMILVLDYMRTRLGLKPEQYTKEDIEFEDITNIKNTL